MTFIIRDDLQHFSRVPFLPDDTNSVDRWFQVPDGRSVAEVRSLIDLLIAKGLDGDVLIDPFSGAGSAAVAAAESGRSFLGIDAYPPRALYTLAKCSAFRGGAALARILARELADPPKTIRELIAAYRDEPNLLAILGAHVIASAEGVSTSGDRAAKMVVDLTAVRYDELSTFDSYCFDVRADIVPLAPDSRSAMVVTSPTHPATRATFGQRAVQAVDAAEALLRHFRKLSGAWDGIPNQAGSLRGMFRLLNACYPNIRGLVVEFEDDELRRSSKLILDVAGQCGYRALEQVVTYRGSPDGYEGRAGGFLVLTRIE